MNAINAVQTSCIRLDGNTQSRSLISEEVVAEYAEAMKAGAEFPAVVLFFDGVDHWLADGFHRYHATAKAGYPSIEADVRTGTKRDAILFSVGTNDRHGLRRSNADKRRAVETMLNDEEWSVWSSREIAKQCRVSHTFVDGIRDSHLATLPDSGERTVTRNGKTYKQKTGNIGAKPQATPDAGTDESYNPDDDALAEARDTINTLAAENDALKDRIAVGVMAGTDEEKTVAVETIDSLRAEVQSLTLEVETLKNSRNFYQNENAELKRQCALQRKQIAGLKK